MSLADRLDEAMARGPAPNGGKWTASSLAEAIRKNDPGARVGKSFIATLLNGSQSNPSIAAIEAIAAVLGVPADWFLSSSPDDLDYVLRRNSAEAEYLLRLHAGLSPERRAALVDLAEQAREVEGLPAVKLPSPQVTDLDSPRTIWGWLRRWRGEPVSDDELVRRITESLRGPDRGDEK